MYFAMSASMAMSVACSGCRQMSPDVPHIHEAFHACTKAGRAIMPASEWALPLTQEPPAVSADMTQALGPLHQPNLQHSQKR